MFNFRDSRTGSRTLASSVLVASLLHSTALHAASPELPRQVVDTAMPTPTGKTITVSAGGDFQAALNTAALGDVIVLQAGATYSGPFTLPNKSGSGWIIVRSSADSSLPAPGTRVAPTDATNMAKILAPTDSSPAVQTAAIESAAREVLGGAARASTHTKPPLWDGRAAQRVVDVLSGVAVRRAKTRDPVTDVPSQSRASDSSI